jgi:hypothetical protein
MANRYSVVLKFFINLNSHSVFEYESKIKFVAVKLMGSSNYTQCSTDTQHLCDQNINSNFAQFLEKVALKCHNMYIKAKFESLKHPHQTTFEILKYQQQAMCGNCLFG